MGSGRASAEGSRLQHEETDATKSSASIAIIGAMVPPGNHCSSVGLITQGPQGPHDAIGEFQTR